MKEPNTDITKNVFIYTEQRKGDMWLIKECISCNIEYCVDYEIEIGLATDLTTV